MDEDTEFCRVCRGEATEDQPLFHPCKCSGSIRYVHQDCLIQWLSHSRKKHCELCKHQFTFTPVYSNDMPENLPYYLIAKGLLFQLISGVILFIRVNFVIIIWLMFLPNFISNLSRGSFKLIKSIFNYSIQIRHELQTYKPDGIIEEAANTTKIVGTTLVPSITYEFLFSSSDEKWSIHSKIFAWLLSESVEGLLIIFSIVVSGLLVFLIREWVIQNNFDFNENVDEQVNGQNAEPARVPWRINQDRRDDIQNANEGLDRVLEILANENRNPNVFEDQQLPGLDNINQHNIERAVNRNENLIRQQDQFSPNANIGSNTVNAQNGFSGTSNDTQSYPPPGQFHENDHFENSFTRNTIISGSERESSPPSSSVYDPSVYNQSPISSPQANPSPELNQSFTSINSTRRLPISHNRDRITSDAMSSAGPSDTNRDSLRAPKSSSTSSYTPSKPTHNYNLRSRKKLSNSGISENSNIDPFIDTEGNTKYEDEDADDLNPFSIKSHKNLPNVGTSEHPNRDPFIETEQNAPPNNANVHNPFAPPRRVPNYRPYNGGENNFPIAQPHNHRDNIEPQRVEPEPIAPPPAPEPAQQVEPRQNIFGPDQENGDANQRAREEMDGIMEALGIRGPLLPALQNYVTVLLVLSLAFTIFAILPYFIGFLGLAFEPVCFFRSSLKTLQLLTDPIFDLLLDVTVSIFFKSIAKFKDLILNLIPKFITTEIYIPEFKLDWRVVKPAKEALTVTAIPEGTTANLLPLSKGGFFNNYIQWYVSFYYFCNQETLLSRLILIGMGYILIVIFLTLFVLLTPQDNLTDLNLVILRRQIALGGLMLRVALFLIMEIILFPTFYGFVINFLFLSAFKDATLASRFDFVVNNPITAVFVHWCLGTVFMFHFATFLKKCRDYFRPGVMWFVRDPADPNFHPFREILHRPILTQLKKIAYSCLLYLSIILISRMAVGPILGNPIAPVIPAGSIETKEFIKPYMWYLIFQLVPPNYFISNSSIWPFLVSKYQKWMKDVAAYLRLSSFLFHNRTIDEEVTMIPKTLWAYLIPFPKPNSPYHERQRDGSVLLVPTKDHIVVAPNRRVIIPLGDDLNPIDSAIELPSYPTTIVYAPPNFYPRLFIFVFIMFFIGFSLLSCVYLFPTLLARKLVYPLVTSATKIPIPNYDGVDFMIGLLILITFSYIIKFNKEEVQRIRRLTRVSHNYTIGIALKLIKFNISVIYIGSLINFLIPTLFGFFLDPYVFYFFGNYDSTLNFINDYLNEPFITVIFDRWLVGSVFFKILYNLSTHIPVPPNDPIITTLSYFNNTEVYKNSITNVNKALLGPLVFKPFLSVLLPPASVLLTKKYFPQVSFNESLPQLYIIVFGVMLLFTIEKFFQTHFNTWINQIRDDYYLLGQALHNMDPTNTHQTTETETQQPVNDQFHAHAN